MFIWYAKPLPERTMELYMSVEYGPTLQKGVSLYNPFLTFNTGHIFLTQNFNILICVTNWYVSKTLQIEVPNSKNFVAEIYAALINSLFLCDILVHTSYNLCMILQECRS